MKYKVRFIEHKVTEVVIEVDDDDINRQFAEMGDLDEDDPMGRDDPRWEVERIAYSAAFGDGEYIEHNIYEDGGIEKRSIEAVTES